MTEVILTRGLPASGKSTWAKAWVAADPSSRVRVNRDDIRFQLYGSYWGEGVDENVVSKVEEAMVKAAVDAGKSVVIDATHLASRYIRRWINLGYSVKVEEFEATINDLVGRDMGRAKSVSAKVIRDMAQRFHIKDDGKLPTLPDLTQTAPQWKPAIQGDRDAIIVDIDGTLASHEGIRSPYDTSRYHLDDVHYNVALIVDMLRYDAETALIVVSGRDEAFRDVTERWLRVNAGIYPDMLLMRPEGDTRNDAIVKHELYHTHIAGEFNVLGVFDDRGRVLRMWRAIGLTTFAVGDTDNYNF